MQPPPPPPDAAERTERHLRSVAELADDAMQLARHAARRALRHAAAVEDAEAAGLPPPPLPRPAGPDPVDAFCRMCREVCRLITLEAKVAAGWKDLNRDRMRTGRIERRRTRVRRIMQDAVWIEPGGPDRETALQAIDDALEDDEIEEMMAEDALIGDVVVAICRGCGLLVDEDLLPNEARHTTAPLFPPVYRPPPPIRLHGASCGEPPTQLHGELARGRGPDPP